MNNKRREKIQKALDSLTEARDEEQEAFDNLPESFQYSKRGEAMEGNVQQLEEAVDALEDLLSR